MTGERIVRDGFDPCLDILTRHLDSKLPGKLQNKHRTVHSLQFTFERLEVDMLVSPFWREPRSFYHFLETIDQRKWSM